VTLACKNIGLHVFWFDAIENIKYKIFIIHFIAKLFMMEELGLLE